ncbi:MAG: cell division protein FtsH [Treponema sp.]|nr:MAG: cell division protein FtsH [Treponema sp.]
MSEDNKDKKDLNDPFNFFFKGDDDGSDKKPKKPKRFPFFALFALIMVMFLLFSMLFEGVSESKLIPFSEFKDRIARGEIKNVVMGNVYFTGYTKVDVDVPKSSFSFLSKPEENNFQTIGVYSDEFITFLEEHKVVYSIQVQKRNVFLELIQWSLPFIILILFFSFMMKRMSKNLGGGLGGSFFSGGPSRHATAVEGNVKTRFNDVAGVDEAKEELVEVVDFLKYPKKYTDIGGKIPRGVLLVGPPGTGKTLLARAVAGESGVPFFRISGSDFVEMFVGVGASRVRSLFKEARDKAPCIIFIDELDAIGKSRMNSVNSNDEREQTLNQLLVEMDGFDGSSGLIVLAATNRPDVLDPALLRPGRFDRQISVDRPDVKGREEILKIHAKDVKIEKDVKLEAIARITSGFSGADLANVINEAALLAVRSGRKKVIFEDLSEAVEKSIGGLQKKSRVIKEKERKIIAYHETGHAIVSAFTEGADPVHKISIIPRGIAALGYTMNIPEEDTYLQTTEDLMAEVDVLLGGRAAEKVIFNEVSTGASNDLSRATDIIRSMITDYGMSDKFFNVALTKRGAGSRDPHLVREYAETTQQYIDEEIARIIAERYDAVIKLVKSKLDMVEYIAKRLLEKEVIEKAEFEEIINAGETVKQLPSSETPAEDLKISE